ncbi:MAG: hypothetical protein NXY57DRAFT_1111834 [Lentinula lateritia]|nr:MAG: hypothetical protein NXY57DRAFT_1111834 [Lentinula lateritia]
MEARGMGLTNSSLPYQDLNGNYPFNIESIPSQVLVSKKDGSNEVSCKVCNSRLKLSDMRTHVGAHTLFMLRGWQDPENEDMDLIGPNPCGGDKEEGPAYTLPEVPLEFIISTFTSMKEEAALGVDEDATKEYWNMYGIPMSDDLEVLARKRALSDTDNVLQAYKRR